jgi:NAD(P)-dependent dehydrogenase (short-subunit alcohol dehydrogenase family)
MTDTNPLIVKKVEQRLHNTIGQCKTFSIRSYDPYQIETALIKAYSFLGTLNCAINNFSLSGDSTNIIDCSIDLCNKSMRIPFITFFLCMKYELSLMLGQHKGGSIINFFHLKNMVDYSESHVTVAALYSVRGLTKSVARTYSNSGISINSFLVHERMPDKNAGSNMPVQQVIDLIAPPEASPVDSIIDKVYDIIMNAGLQQDTIGKY